MYSILRIFSQLLIGNFTLDGGFASGVKRGVQITGLFGYGDGESATPYADTAVDTSAAIVAADTIFNVLSEASQAHRCFLTPSQLMLWNRTFSPYNPGKKGTKYTQGCKPHGDMSTPEEDFFDCAWKIQAHHELMETRKFNSSCINHIARKCFPRFPREKFAKHTQPGGSYFGRFPSA